MAGYILPWPKIHVLLWGWREPDLVYKTSIFKSDITVTPIPLLPQIVICNGEYCYASVEELLVRQSIDYQITQSWTTMICFCEEEES